MEKDVEKIYEDTAGNPQGLDDTELTEDQKLIKKWALAQAEAPTRSEMDGLMSKIEEKEAEVRSLTEMHEKMAVERALVFGWTEVAEEVGVSAKRLHGWRRQHLPDAEDLTEIHKTVIPREQKRLEQMEKKLEEKRILEEKYEAQRNRFSTMMEGWK